MIHLIEIDGKRMPFKFNLIACARFEEQTNRAIPKVFEEYASGAGRISDIIHMIHQGLKEGHRLDSKEYTLEWEDVAIMMGNDPAASQKAMELIAQDQAPPEGAKKKTTQARAVKR